MMFFADISTTRVIKKIVGVVAVLALIAAAVVVLMPALSSAQVGTPESVCEDAGGVWNGATCENLNAEGIACFVFTELNLPLPERCEDSEEPVDACTNEQTDPGVQENGPCNADDVCPNDAGIQLSEEECTPADNGEGGGNENENNGGNTENNGGGSSPSGGGGLSGGGSMGGLVLGASTDEVCADPLITSYMGLGKNNDLAEVVKLQIFLNKELGLTLPITGVFGSDTNAAVEQFQIKYASEVLAPWIPFGLMSDKTPTGYVYKTTKRMINKIHCAALDIPMPQLP